MPTADHLGHVHLKVRDLDRAVDFYGSLLGLGVTERHANFAFLSFGDHHHDLALQEVSDDAPPAELGPTVGLYHSAWEVADAAALRTTYEYLREQGTEVTAVDHGISKALYLDDPDGNGVEVYLDTRAEKNREAWEGRNTRFDPGALRTAD
ncbi:VOC family protein [Halobium salinum]|uniref:VOC family protein n=1 Tax=Halobium salinum TaxID=1364940 RepID=A0ABD5PDV1_9EURY|nr:VOC family protein [Halobium salinum]